MKIPNRRHAPLVAALTALAVVPSFVGCAISPDYSNYDWHQRGGMVEEQDRSLAGARIEPFQGNRRIVRSDVSITPVGATPASQQAVVIDPAAPDIVAEGRPRTAGTTRIRR